MRWPRRSANPIMPTPTSIIAQVEGSGTVVETGERQTGGRHRPPKLYRAVVPDGSAGPLRTAGPLA